MSRILKMASHYFSRSSNKNKNKQGTDGLNQPQFNILSAEKEEKTEEKNTEDFCKLFIGGLSQLTTSQDLETYFSQFGKVIDSAVPRFHKSGKTRGFGFVTFNDPEGAKVALEKEIHILGGKSVDVKVFKSQIHQMYSSENQRNARIFLGGLPQEVTEEILKQFFSSYGEVVDVVIPHDKITKNPKGFAFLSFKDEVVAEKCKAQRFVFLRGKRVYIDKAERRDKSKMNDCESPEESLTGASDFEDDEDIQSVSSGEDCLTMEQSLELKELFKNYFSHTLEGFDVTSGKKANENETRQANSDVTEVEKQLADFFISSVNDLRVSRENLIEFSNESETESDNENAIPQPRNCVTGSLSCDNLKMPEKLSKNSTPKSNEAKATDSNDNKKSIPLQIRNSEGLYICSICQWVSPNDSARSFLTHCNTPCHKAKLKDRFALEEQGGVQAKKQPQKSESKLSVASVIEANAKQKDQKEKQGQTATAVKKNRMNKIKARQNSKKKDNALKTLTKVHTLIEELSCIKPLPEKELMCMICNKKIPQSTELEHLMKNLTIHLRSRRHLKNISSGKGNSCQTEPLPTTSVGKKNKEKNSTSQGQKMKLKSNENKNRTFPVVKTLQPAPNNPQKEKPAEKEDPASSFLFLCLPCNVVCQEIEAFNVHLDLKFHSDKFGSKNLTNMGKCKICQTYLYGSLYQINEHYSKCAQK